ncbi:MAG: dihydroorotase, partial [Flavobacteriales bacterium]
PRRIALKQKLKIEEGEKANITLFNPKVEWKVTNSDIKSKSRNTPFIGEKLKGKAVAIYNNNQFVIIE